MIRWAEVLGILGGGEVGFCEDFPVFGGFLGLVFGCGRGVEDCWMLGEIRGGIQRDFEGVSGLGLQ